MSHLGRIREGQWGDSPEPCLALTACLLHDDLEGRPEGQAAALIPEPHSPGLGAGFAAGPAAAPRQQGGP